MQSLPSVHDNSIGECGVDILPEYKRLFRGRTDTYALQQRDGSYTRVKMPVTDTVLTAHLSGKLTIGLYVVTPVENTCGFMAIDVDNRARTLAESVISAARVVGLSDDEFLLESSGNKGFHLWVFFAEKEPASVAIALGQRICKEACLLGKVEIFPKQAHVSADGYGNAIKLPGFHAKSQRWSKFFSPDFSVFPATALRNIRQISRQRLESLQSGPITIVPTVSIGKGTTALHKTIPCIAQFFDGVNEGDRNFAALRLAVFLKDHGLPVTIAAGTLEAWNTHNIPPLTLSEVNRIVRYAYLKDYHGYGCSHQQMQQFCDRDTCPIEQARRRAAIPRK